MYKKMFFRPRLARWSVLQGQNVLRDQATQQRTLTQVNVVDVVVAVVVVGDVNQEKRRNRITLC